jgi:Tfp pilus assembly protein FimT
MRISSKGLTLLEMVIALGAIVLIAGLGVFCFWELYPSLHLQGAVKDVVLDIQAARMQAIAQNRYCRLVFFPGQDSYQIEKASEAGGARWPGTPEGTAREFNNPDSLYHHPGVDLWSSSANPVFSPRGTAAGATIVLKSGEQQKVITISFQGRVRVQ